MSLAHIIAQPSPVPSNLSNIYLPPRDVFVNNLTVNGAVVAVGQFEAAAGSAAAPSYSFALNTNTGLYNSAANVISASANGAQVAQLNTGGVDAIDGSASLPSYGFLSQQNSGHYRAAANTVSTAANGIRALDVTPTQLVLVPQYAQVALNANGSSGFLYTHGSSNNDEMDMGYNCYFDSAGTAHIPNPAGQTSRVFCTYNTIEAYISRVGGASPIAANAAGSLKLDSLGNLFLGMYQPGTNDSANLVVGADQTAANAGGWSLSQCSAGNTVKDFVIKDLNTNQTRLSISTAGVVNVPGNFSAGNVLSGSWTPTLTAGTGTSTLALVRASYIQIGSYVQFNVSFTLTSTGTGTSLVFNISVPVASAMTAASDCGGSGAISPATTNGCIPLILTCDSTNHNILVAGTVTALIAASGLAGSVSGMYLIH